MSKITDIKDKRISSIERENIIYDLWNSGRYETEENLSQELKITEKRVKSLLYAYAIRKKLINNSITNLISSRTILDSRTLSEKDKKKLYDMIAHKIIKPNEVREYIRETKKNYKKEKSASFSASSSASKIVKIQNETDSQKKIRDKITLFQNITFKIMNRLKYNTIKDLPKWAKDECKSLLLMIVRHCQGVLEELDQIYTLNRRGKIIEIN